MYVQGLKHNEWKEINDAELEAFTETRESLINENMPCLISASNEYELLYLKSLVGNVIYAFLMQNDIPLMIVPDMMTHDGAIKNNKIILDLLTKHFKTQKKEE